jgi:hypothetical protein
VARIRFYLDENAPVAVAAQLARLDIEAVTGRDLGLRGESDINHPQRATRLGCGFCAHDADFVEMATTGIAHTGVIFGQQHRRGVASWVKFLELIYKVCTAEAMRDRVEYVKS